MFSAELVACLSRTTSSGRGNFALTFKCLTTIVAHCCHLISRSAATGVGVHLPSAIGHAVHSLSCASSMPGPPIKLTMDNLAAARQKVGHLEPTLAATSSRTFPTISACSTFTFTFGTVTGTNNLRGNPDFLVGWFQQVPCGGEAG